MTLLPALVNDLLVADDDRAHYAALGPITDTGTRGLQLALAERAAQAIMNNQPALALVLSLAVTRLSETTSPVSAVAA